LNDEVIRIHKKLKSKIDFIRGKCMMEGKRVPSISEVTKKIAENIKEEEMYNEFI